MGVKSLTIGDELNLECKASGTPTPNITWTRNDDDVQLATGTGKATLTISSVTREDGGVYKCTATNIAGSNSNMATVEVKQSKLLICCKT